MESLSTGKSFTLSTTLDTNPFHGTLLPNFKPPEVDALPFTRDVIYDPVLGRQIFVQQTPLGPIATVPTILPNQLHNVTDAYNATVKKLINHVPTSSAILRDTKVFARCQRDGYFYPATVSEHVEGNKFIIEFDEKYMSGLCMQNTPSFDLIAYDDAMRHAVGEGDFCLAPIESGNSPFLPGKILFDDEISENLFKVQFCDQTTIAVDIDKVCWIPSILYDRIVAELISPQARMQTVQSANNTGTESHSIHHPLDIFLNGTPKFQLSSGVQLPVSSISRSWYPVSYQGVRYLPTFPVPWLPNYWPNDVTMWPQYLLPFRRTFAAVDTNQRLPGLKMSVNELDKKIDTTLDSARNVLNQTSGSYLDRMESFLSKHDNEAITKIIRQEHVDENFEVDFDWNILGKETCEVGENTVVSIRNKICNRRWKQLNPSDKKPWIKYWKASTEEAPPSVVRAGTYNDKERPHGYSDDDYTLWRLKNKQIKTLEELHQRKAEFITKEVNLVKHQEQELKQRIETLDKKVKNAESFFVQ